jgi:hypothetical protein
MGCEGVHGIKLLRMGFCYGHCNVSSDLVKREEFLELLSDCQFLKESGTISGVLDILKARRLHAFNT